jgi:hypothetical protein
MAFAYNAITFVNDITASYVIISLSKIDKGSLTG